MAIARPEIPCAYGPATPTGKGRAAYQTVVLRLDRRTDCHHTSAEFLQRSARQVSASLQVRLDFNQIEIGDRSAGQAGG